MDTEVEPLYTIEQVAEMFTVRPATAREWVKAGKFPGAIKIGRYWRVPRSSIRTMIESSAS